MPKKPVAQAEHELEQAREVQLAYLIRNPEFRKDLQDLAEMSDAIWHKRMKMTEAQAAVALGPVVEKALQVGAAWNLPFDVALQLSRSAWRADGAPHRRYSASEFRFGSPIVAWSTPPSALLGGASMPRNDASQNTRHLSMSVDLAYPVETLLPLIEKEVRKHSKAHARGRQRLDQADFYCKVFDLAENGQTFRTIARELRRPLSTVKSAYLAACHNIFGPSGGPSKTVLPVASFDWENFDAEAHYASCAECRRAKDADAMCALIRAIVRQDERGQRELTGYDTVRDRPSSSRAAE